MKPTSVLQRCWAVAKLRQQVLSPPCSSTHTPENQHTHSPKKPTPVQSRTPAAHASLAQLQALPHLAVIVVLVDVCTCTHIILLNYCIPTHSWPALPSAPPFSQCRSVPFSFCWTLDELHNNLSLTHTHDALQKVFFNGDHFFFKGQRVI